MLGHVILARAEESKSLLGKIKEVPGCRNAKPHKGSTLDSL